MDFKLYHESDLVDQGKIRVYEANPQTIAYESNNSTKRLPFIMVHPYGIDHTFYTNFADELGSDQPFFVVQLPFTYQNEGVKSLSIAFMAKEVIRALDDSIAKEQYFLGGWSFGGVVAFEVASQLSAKKPGSMEHLLLLDPPILLDDGKKYQDEIYANNPLFYLFWFARFLSVKENKELSLSFSQIKNPPHNYSIEYLYEVLFRKGVISSDSSNTSLQKFRNNYSLYVSSMLSLDAQIDQHQFTPEPITLHIFKAKCALDDGPKKPDLGWERASLKKINIMEVDGDHFSIFSQPHVKALTRLLKDKLRRIADDGKTNKSDGKVRSSDDSCGTQRVKKVFNAKSKDDLITYYKDWAEEYERDLINAGYRYPPIVSGLIGKYLPYSSKILDAGAGTGIMGEILQLLGYGNLAAVDISPDMLKIAEMKHVYEKIQVMDIENMSFSSAEFDAVICLGVFTQGHASAESLNEFVRVTKKGGYLIFSITSPAYDNAGFKEKLAELENNHEIEKIIVTQPFDPGPLTDEILEARIYVYKVISY